MVYGGTNGTPSRLTIPAQEDSAFSVLGVNSISSPIPQWKKIFITSQTNSVAIGADAEYYANKGTTLVGASAKAVSRINGVSVPPDGQIVLASGGTSKLVIGSAGELAFKPTDNQQTFGSVGAPGEVVISGGPGQPPSWVNLRNLTGTQANYTLTLQTFNDYADIFTFTFDWTARFILEVWAKTPGAGPGEVLNKVWIQEWQFLSAPTINPNSPFFKELKLLNTIYTTTNENPNNYFSVELSNAQSNNAIRVTNKVPSGSAIASINIRSTAYGVTGRAQY
jgi:hypothetical protein